MTVDFTKPVLLMPDGSYVVTTRDPAYPYNVLPDDPMWQSIQDWLAMGNTAEEYKPPEAKAISVDPDMQLNAEIMADYIETQKQTKKWQERSKQLRSS